MLVLLSSAPSIPAPRSLPVLAALLLIAIWLLRRIVKVLLVVGVIAVLAASSLGVHGRREYVADSSVFLDNPPGGAACRTHIDREYLDDPSLTLLVPTPTVFFAARRGKGLARLRPTPLGATIRPIIETWGEHLPPDAVIVATARQHGVPLLTADRPTAERHRLWRGIRVIHACPG